MTCDIRPSLIFRLVVLLIYKTGDGRRETGDRRRWETEDGRQKTRTIRGWGRSLTIVGKEG